MNQRSKVERLRALSGVFAVALLVHVATMYLYMSFPPVVPMWLFMVDFVVSMVALCVAVVALVLQRRLEKMG